jgi:hypothetical protein
MSMDGTPKALIRGGNAALWVNMLGAPMIWSAEMLVNYALVPRECLAGDRWILHLVWGGALAMAVVIGISSLYQWRLLGRSDAEHQERFRFMVKVGCLNSLLFGMLILAQGIACIIFDPCLK